MSPLFLTAPNKVPESRHAEMLWETKYRFSVRITDWAKANVSLSSKGKAAFTDCLLGTMIFDSLIPISSVSWE